MCVIRKTDDLGLFGAVSLDFYNLDNLQQLDDERRLGHLQCVEHLLHAKRRGSDEIRLRIGQEQQLAFAIVNVLNHVEHRSLPRGKQN